jgi:hypothetical protein
MQKRIGPYQRPAPPRKPLGFGTSKSVQKPAVPMHEIEAQARAVIETALGAARKPGRPPINGQAMTAAERQARRCELESLRQIGAAHGKSHAEVKSGGYDSTKIETIYGLREIEFQGMDDGLETHVGRQVRAGGESSAAHEQTTDEVLNSGESSVHRGGLERHEVQEIHVRGLQFGDEESNRRRFAENELKKMVEEYFTLPDSSPSASWIAKHVGNISIHNHARPSITLTCKLCADSMDSIDDAQDHLRVDHRKAIDAWFRNLVPRREFRDTTDFVTVVTPRRHGSRLVS